jgi:hypothetical protein
MSTKRFGITERVVSTLGIGLVLSASWGCAPPQPDDAVTEKSAIGWGVVSPFVPIGGDSGSQTDWDTFFSDAKELYDDAKVVASFFSTAGAVLSAAQTVGQLLGILSPPVDPSVKVIAAVNAIGQGLSWQISDTFLERSYADLQGTIQTIDTFTTSGMTYDFNSPGYQNSVDAVAEVEQPSQFQHVSVPDGNKGGNLPVPSASWGTYNTNWKNVVTDSPAVDGMGLVYDWRRALPLLMKMISMRLFVVGMVDPNFRTDHWFDSEIAAHRNALKSHYDTLSNGIRCASKDFQYAAVHQSTPVYACNVVCADIYTGISAISTFTPDPPPAGQAWSSSNVSAKCATVKRTQPAAYANAVNSAAWYVRSKLPLFQLRSMIDQLYTFLHPSWDFTQLEHRISSEPAQNLCVDVPGANTANGTPLQLYPCHGGANQQWTYDRTTGQIRNGIGTCMDQRWSVNPGTVPGTWACDVPQGTPARISNTAQMWSYDPETRTLMNGLGTTLMASSFAQWAPLWNEGQGAGFLSTLTHQNGDLAWRDDVVLPSSSCGTLHAGEGLNVGSSVGSNLYSCDGRFDLVVSQSGLSLWEVDGGNQSLLWAQSIGGLNGGSFVAMQGDGNFVAYPGPGITATWASNTAGYPGAYLAVQSDGNVVIYDATNQWRWQSGTPGH